MGIIIFTTETLNKLCKFGYASNVVFTISQQYNTVVVALINVFNGSTPSITYICSCNIIYVLVKSFFTCYPIKVFCLSTKRVKRFSLKR